MAGLLDLSIMDPNFLASMLKGGTPAAAPMAAAAPAQAPQGGILDGLFAPKAEQPMTNGNRWNILGATLRDVGDSLRGKDGKALATAEQAVAGGGSGAGAGKGGKKAPGQPTDTALLYQTAQSLFPGDPKAQFLFATGNGDFLKSLGEGYGFHEVTGGNTAFGVPGQTGAYTAPKLVDHGGQYGTQTSGGYTGTGEAAPSYADQTGQQNAQTDLQRLAETVRHDKTDEGQGAQRIGIDGGNLDVSRKGLAMRGLEFGHTLNPTAPVVRAQADYDKLQPGMTYVAPDGSLRTKGGR